MNNSQKHQTSQLSLGLRNMKNNGKRIPPSKEKNIRIPDEDVKTRLHELMVMNTRTFQRLFDIKQLGLAHLVYPWATHTRGSHSISCLFWAQKIMAHLKTNLFYSNFSEKDYFLTHLEKNENVIRLTALLHDISHIPFSHTLEDENLIFERHDKSKRLHAIIDNLREDIKSLDKLECSQLFFRLTENEYRAIKRNLPEWIEKVEEILNLNNKKVEKLKDQEKDIYYITDIIGNTICADLLSYIEKDAQIAGTGGKAAGVYRLFDYFEIRRDDEGRARLVTKLTKEGYPRHDVIPIISEILDKRYAISYQITYHHAKLAASAMLGKIARLINLKETEKLYKIGDEGFLNLLEEKIENECKSRSKDVKKERFEGAKKLLARLRSRRLYKRFYIIPYSNRHTHGMGDLKDMTSHSKGYEKLETFEGEIEKVGLDPGDIIILAPQLGFKEVKTMVVYEESRGRERVRELNSEDCKEFIKREFDESLADQIRILERKYNALWKLYAFINPEKIRLHGEEIRRKLDRIFEGKGTAQFREYWDKIKEMQISRMISEKINIENFDERAKVHQNLPKAIEEVAARGKSKSSENEFYIPENVESIIRKAKAFVNEGTK